MTRGKRGSQPDPSTISGKPETGVGSGGALQLLERNNPQQVIQELEFSDPNTSAPSDLVATFDGMAGTGTIDDPKIITNDQELQAMSNDLTANYALGNNIDCSETDQWNGGSGFNPVGVSNKFKGGLDGQNHVIKGLYVNRADDSGLFGDFTSQSPGETYAENLVLFDFDITATGDFNNGGALAGSFSQNEEPSEDYRKRIENILVIGSSISGYSTGGLVGYSSISVTVESVGVSDCIVNVSNTDGDGGGCIGVIGGYDWGTDAGSNYQIFRDIYVYNVNITGADGRIGYLSSSIYSAGSFDTLAEYWTEVTDVFLDDESSDLSVLEESQIVDDVELARVAPVYVEGARDYADVLSGAASGTEEVNIVSLTSDEITGASVEDLATSPDFQSVWSIVEEDVDTSIYADGLPVLSGDYEILQASGQGLGDPFISDLKGVTDDGLFVNTKEELYRSKKESIRVGQIYPNNTRLMSEAQGYGGSFASINSVPREASATYATVRDPQNPRRIVRIGGIYQDGGGTNKTITQTFNVWKGEFEENVYNDLSDDISSLSSQSLSDFPIAGTVGSYILVAGGSDEDINFQADVTNRIFLLDTSAGTPTWTETTETLPTGVNFAARTVYNGLIYAWGGGNDSGSNVTQAITLDPTAGDGNIVSTAPTNLPEPFDSGQKVPVVDGIAYMSGFGDNTGNQAFYSYDIENDSYTQLPDVDGLLYGGQSSSGSGASGGPAYHHNGYIYLHSGGNGHGKIDIVAWSIQDEDFTQIEPDLFSGGGTVNIYNTPYTNTLGYCMSEKFGNVIVAPGTGNNSASTFVYVVPEDPKRFK